MTTTDTAPLSAEDDDDLDRIGKLMDAIAAEADARRAELEDWKARATQAEAERDEARGEGYKSAVADAAETLAVQANMNADLQAALSASQAREAGLREAAYTAMGKLNSAIYRANFIEKWHADPNCDVQTRATEAKAFAQAAKDVLVEAVNALSPAQPAQDRIAAASAFIDRNGPVAGADRFEGPEVSGPDGLVNGQWPPLVTAYDNGVDHAWGVAQPLAEAAEGVINWCDFAMSQPGEFDAHGVRNLSGPAFDKLREAVEAVRSAGLLTTETEGSNG